MSEINIRHKCKIESDGIARNTVVTINGRKIDGVLKSVKWEANSTDKKVASVVLELVGVTVDVEIEGYATIMRLDAPRKPETDNESH